MVHEVKRFRKGRKAGRRATVKPRTFRKTKSRGSETWRWMAREQPREASSGKIPASRLPRPPASGLANSRTMILSARPSFRFLFFISLFFFSRTLFSRKSRCVFRNDLQSSTPEEYLDGRVLADEAGLGDGPLAVEGDGGLPTQSGIDDRRDFLLLLQRLLLVSAKSVKTTFVRGPWSLTSD